VGDQLAQRMKLGVLGTAKVVRAGNSPRVVTQVLLCKNIGRGIKRRKKKNWTEQD